MILAASILALTSAVFVLQEPSARDMVFLAENRPVFVRVRVTAKDRPFEEAWMSSVKTIHATLDRNGDGKLTTKEADPAVLAALVKLETGAPQPAAIGDLDVSPKDESVSVEELAAALRPILGPFRLQVARQATSRTDALFDQLDRDKDGQLTRLELSVIAGSLRPLDLDDNDMISADELEPFNNPAVMAQVAQSSERRARFTTLPPVVELVAGESSLRSARLLLKKYDNQGKDGTPGKPDGKLSASEFGVAQEAFDAADTNHDASLNTDELRKFLAQPPMDLVLDVHFPNEPNGVATVKVGGDSVVSKDAKVRQLADGDLEFAVGQVRLDVHVDAGDTSADEVRRLLQQRFKVSDTNKDGYLEGKEREGFNAAGSPLAGLADVIDRDADGKLYLKELLDFGDRLIEAARCRLDVATSDQGRAIFGILDLDKDRRLGTREVLRTVDRVTTWDGDSDGRVSADEIPYHFQVDIARGVLTGLASEGMAVNNNVLAARTGAPAAGPDWFRKMDRNHDGDISRREFLGPRNQFDRLDRDKDGLIDADEAK